MSALNWAVPLVVFDLDGTLVDSRADLAISVNELLKELGAAPLPHACVTSMVGEGARVLVDRALTAAGVSAPDAPEALERFLQIYDRHLLDHTRPYDGIPEMLDRLRAVARLAVLTNKPAQATIKLLAGLELQDAFVEVIGGDSAFPRKPDPSALLHLVGAHASAGGLAWMVGDSRIDLETANAAGIGCCLVRYGFGLPADETLPASVLIADSPLEVVSLLMPLLRRAQ